MLESSNQVNSEGHATGAIALPTRPRWRRGNDGGSAPLAITGFVRDVQVIADGGVALKPQKVKEIFVGILKRLSMHNVGREGIVVVMTNFIPECIGVR